MWKPEKAPNRLLDLGELMQEPYRSLLARLEELEGREALSYLHPSKRWEYPWALERADLAPGSRVLDAGCGASIFPIYLATEGHQVTAVDLDPPLGLAELHGVQVDYVRASLPWLPLGAAHFDAVFCISVIEHLGTAGVPSALQELRRVLRPGGKLLLTTDYYEDSRAKLHYDKDGVTFPVEWNFFDEASLREKILAASGLEVIGAVDLSVDWERTRRLMRAFHGYPYTSVGVALKRM